MADWFPLVSQVKSLVQAYCGDREGAIQTQVNFSRQCPVVSQVRSVVELVTGDEEAAIETQKQCRRTLFRIVDSVPVAGHVKGAIHYACDDREGGDRAMKDASRSVAVIGGALGGSLVGGPVGAVAGAIGAGGAMDGVITKIDSAVHNEYRPNGYIHHVTEVVKDPTNPGKCFDAVFAPVMDGMTGLMASKYVEATLDSKIGQKGGLDKTVGTISADTIVKHADLAKINQVLPNKSGNHVISVVEDRNTGHQHVGRNVDARRKVGQKNGLSKSQAKKVPNPRQVRARSSRLNEPHPIRDRDPGTCAEHHAYEGYYNSSSATGPKGTVISTFKILRDGTIQAIERCENCKFFSDAMGEVLTDGIDGLSIPTASELRACYDKCTSCGAYTAAVIVISRSKKKKKKIQN